MELVWDQIGEKLYEVGVSNGVLYPVDSKSKEKPYPKGYAWNGLSAVNENPSGAEANDIYADNAKYLTLLSAETYATTIEAYTYPDEFKPCMGKDDIATGVTVGQQIHKGFGFAYKSLVGNDTEDTDYGYKLHLIYGCKASPSESQHQTTNGGTDVPTMSWEVNTTPVAVKGKKPTASVEIDSTKCSEAAMKAIEAALFGTADTDAWLPLPDEVAKIMADADAAAGTTDPDIHG